VARTPTAQHTNVNSTRSAPRADVRHSMWRQPRWAERHGQRFRGNVTVVAMIVLEKEGSQKLHSRDSKNMVTDAQAGQASANGT